MKLLYIVHAVENQEGLFNLMCTRQKNKSVIHLLVIELIGYLA